MIEILNTYNGSSGEIAYIEFLLDGKKNLLSLKHFEERHGSLDQYVKDED